MPKKKPEVHQSQPTPHRTRSSTSPEEKKSFIYKDPPPTSTFKSPNSKGGNPWLLRSKKLGDGNKQTALPHPGIINGGVKKRFAELSSKVEGNRPAAKYGSPIAGTDIPKEVFTPGGTKLLLTDSNGVLLTYSSKAPKTPPRIMAPDTIKRYLENLNNNADITYKYQEAHITTEGLKKAEDEHRKNNYQRKPGQKQVMGNSGKDLAKGFRKPKDIWELLHMLAHSLAGNKKAQRKDNIIAGTSSANSHMMPVEKLVKLLAEIFPEGVDVSVLAILEPKTEVARDIVYSITAGTQTYTFIFDGQNRIPPCQTEEAYTHLLFYALLEGTGKLDLSILKESALSTTSSAKRTLFSDKEEEVPAKQVPYSLRSGKGGKYMDISL